MQTHLEPLTEEGAATPPNRQEIASDHELVARIVEATTGSPPEELRFLHTDEGLVAYLTLRLEPGTPLAVAHSQASRIEEAVRRARPGITDVIVHTEPEA